jgi:hypothetical protein
MTTEELVTELRASRTDLARFVQAAHRDKLPFMVVGAQSVRPGSRGNRARGQGYENGPRLIASPPSKSERRGRMISRH